MSNAAASLPAEKIDEALAIFAMESGREKPVMEMIQTLKIPVSFKTLKRWAYDDKREHYQRIQSEVEKALRSQMADKFTRIAQMATDVVEASLEEMGVRLENEAGEMKAADLRGILHEAAVAAGISFEKSQLAQGRPTEIVRNTFPDLTRALESRGVRVVLDPGAVKPPEPRPALPPA